MGWPRCRTVEKTCTAIDSGEGRADRGCLHSSLVSGHLEQRLMESPRDENACQNLPGSGIITHGKQTLTTHGS